MQFKTRSQTLHKDIVITMIRVSSFSSSLSFSTSRFELKVFLKMCFQIVGNAFLKA